ncbi:unnamed protein product [Paramecium sonneborni]|uniref:Uncharacterized protein n=1 Tax=Paramecium sonneborni TaxID=65129 RepID=A0A8S1Q7V9_9CILI|nr:unnamed protein product [Paramecium sonneborni]
MYEFENYQFKTVSSDHNSCQEGIKQLEVYDKIARTKFQMTFTKNNQIIYSKDGVILRVQEINIYKIDKNKDAFSHPEGLNNLEQINNLVWQGEYGQNKIKIGKWIAIWKGEVLKEVGGYYSDNGQKQGLWKELIKNYQTEGQGFEFGLYFNNFRIGKWNYFYKNKQINGGYYNDQNQKNGKWFELYNGIWEYFLVYIVISRSFVVYNGEYNNGKKVGKWDILYGEFEDILQFQLKGCGFYDDQKQLSITASKKIGRWVELIHDYGRDSQVSYQGEYQNGKKIGRWDIFFQVSGDYCRFELIGGGTYKEDYKENDANSIKIGRWIELNNEFKNWLQVIITGEYKNGHKFGRWDILFRESSNNLEFKKMQDQNYIKNKYFRGGGQYDEESLDRDSIKIGKWTELYDGFNQDTQITYSGEYIKGKKIGRWDIFLKNWRTIENELMQQIQFNTKYVFQRWWII